MPQCPIIKNLKSKSEKSADGIVDLSKIPIKTKQGRENIEQYHDAKEINDLNSIIVITTKSFPSRKQYNLSLNLRKDKLNIKLLVEELSKSWILISYYTLLKTTFVFVRTHGATFSTHNSCKLFNTVSPLLKIWAEYSQEYPLRFFFYLLNISIANQLQLATRVTF